MTRILNHLRTNLIAYLALFVALGGTSYAALNLPANSVGARQIQNGSIGAVKLDQKSITASIRAWVIVQWGAGGRLVAKASSGPVKVATGGIATGITWPHRHFGRTCMPSVTPQENFNSRVGIADYVTAQFDPTNPPGAFLSLLGFAADGVRGPEAAYVMIICP